MATIQGVYVALFGRPADPSGLTYFNSVTQNGANLNGIGDLASTQEYKDRFAGQNNNTIVNSIYQSLFGRDAEAAGLNFFVDALNKGTLNIKNIAIAILDGAQGTDKTIVTNKVAAADLYTKALDTASEIAGYSGNTAAAQGRAFITGVTTTVPTTAAVDASVKTMVDAGSAGNTIVLTAGTDTVSLTAGLGTPVVFATDRNDTINATAATNDWDATDVINGGFGTDTLNAKIDAAVAVAADGLKSVEILSLNVVTNAVAVDVANAKELTQVWDNASTKALTVNNVALTTSVGVKGAITELTTFAFAGATGTADTATLVADGATGTVGVTIAAIETLNISNTGTTNLGALTVADAKAIAISGSGSLTFTSASTAIETVNASAFSGKVTLDFTAQNALKSYVGGTGSDVITIDGAHTNDITISGGDGADTITVTATGVESKALTISGGAGSDIFVLNASGNVQAIDTAANFVKTLITISDFDKAADAIKFINGVGRDTILVAEQAAIDGAADILAAAQLAAGYTDVTKASIFTYKGDAYLFQNDATLALTAGDSIVKVTGVTSAADFTASNFSLTV